MRRIRSPPGQNSITRYTCRSVVCAEVRQAVGAAAAAASGVAALLTGGSCSGAAQSLHIEEPHDVVVLQRLEDGDLGVQVVLQLPVQPRAHDRLDRHHLRARRGAAELAPGVARVQAVDRDPTLAGAPIHGLDSEQ